MVLVLKEGHVGTLFVWRSNYVNDSLTASMGRSEVWNRASSIYVLCMS